MLSKQEFKLLVISEYRDSLLSQDQRERLEILYDRSSIVQHRYVYGETPKVIIRVLFGHEEHNGWVSAAPLRAGRHMMSRFCDCRNGINCEASRYGLLQFLKDQGEALPPPPLASIAVSTPRNEFNPESWLGSLEGATRKTVSKALMRDSEKLRLALVLRLFGRAAGARSYTRAAGIRVTPLLLQILEDETQQPRVRIRQVSTIREWMATAESGIDPAMAIAFNAIEPTAGDNDEAAPIDSATRRMAFEKLLEHGALLVYQQGENLSPVSVMPPLQAVSTWHEARDGSYRLRVMQDDLDLTDGLLRIGDRYCYAGNADGRVLFAMVEAVGCDLEVCMAAIHTPLAPEHADAVRDHLNRTADTRLPLPPSRLKKRIVRAKPDAFVTTIDGKSGKTAKDRKGKLRVQFEYNGVEIGAAGKALFIESIDETGAAVEIHRDMQAEALVLSTVRQSGLVPVEAADGSLVYQTPREATPGQVALQVMQPLREIGIDVRTARRVAYSLLPDQDDIGMDVSDAADGGYRVRVSVLVEGEEVELLPLVAALLANESLSLEPVPGESPTERILVDIGNGRLLPLPLATVRRILAPIADLLSTNLRKDGLQVRGSTLLAIESAQSAAGFHMHAAQRATEMLEMIRRPRLPTPPPAGFTGTFWEHQVIGHEWLAFLERVGFGGLLADGTGLGKTVQVLTHVLYMKEQGRLTKPVLVLMKVAAREHWPKKAAEFTPGLNVLDLTRKRSAAEYERIPTSDIVFATFGQFARNPDLFSAYSYSLLALDETEDCSNPRTKIWKYARDLRADRKLPICGTPLENHLKEIWALLELAEPGCLGSWARFHEVYYIPIEVNGDKARLAELRRRVAPLMLRRRPDEVEQGLPPVIPELVDLDLDRDHRAIYETIRAPLERQVREAIAMQGVAKAKGIAFKLMIRLRQLCCSAKLLSEYHHGSELGDNAKEKEFYNMVQQMHEDGRHIVVFSAFEQMLFLMARRLEQMGIDYRIISGSSRRREESRVEFNEGKVRVILVSLKAGKSALELPRADVICFYDKWWTRSATDQAIHRVRRPGQTNSKIMVYTFQIRSSIEIRMDQIAARKGALADAFLDEGNFEKSEVTEADLLALFAPLPEPANDDGEPVEEAA